jgi:hypothetical protein
MNILTKELMTLIDVSNKLHDKRQILRRAIRTTLDKKYATLCREQIEEMTRALRHIDTLIDNVRYSASK